jgi:hypothetical protein
MLHLRISYSVWLDLLTENTSWQTYYLQKDNGYSVYSGHENIVYESFTNDMSGFLNLFDDSILVSMADDAMALLSTTTVPPHRDTNGNLIVAPTHFTISESWRMEGIRFTASGNSLTMYDYPITKEILMQGAQWWTVCNSLDDEADFSVIDKTNALGLHTLYGLPVGYPIELKKFINNYHVPSGSHTGLIQAPTVTPIVSGLHVRIAYTNNGDDNAEIGVNYIYYEKT